MTYGRSNLRLKFEGGDVKPEYLDSRRDGGLIGEVIEFYELNLGKPYGSILWEELRAIVGDDKLYKGLRKVMSYFYKPKDVKVAKDLRRLRLKVFRIVNERYGGFLNSKVREEALKEIEHEVGVLGLEDILWADDVNERPLVRIKKPTVKEVVETYNFETIDTICVNSSKLRVKVYGDSLTLNSIAKATGRYCKLYGLIYDARAESGWLEVEVEGPRSLFGRPTRYGLRLTLYLTHMLPRMLNARSWSIEAKTHFTRSTLNVKILTSTFKPEIRVPQVKKPQQVFDSDVEKRIYYTLRGLKLNVRRDVEPIALGNIIYIPDFKVEVNGETYYIEVVGYWRKEYAEKKAYKLSEVSKLNLKLIAIVDEKLKPYMEQVRIPKVYYRVSGDRVVLPYGDLVKMLSGSSTRR